MIRDISIVFGSYLANTGKRKCCEVIKYSILVRVLVLCWCMVRMSTLGQRYTCKTNKREP